jgi:chromosome segregation ATPase
LAQEKDHTRDSRDNASEMLSTLNVIKNQLEIEQKRSSNLQKDNTDLHLQLESINTEISNLTAVNLTEVKKVDLYESSLNLLKIQIDQEKSKTDTCQILNSELTKEKQHHLTQISLNLLRIEELETEIGLARTTITTLEFNAITNKGQLVSSNQANESWQAENRQLKDTVDSYQRSSEVLNSKNDDLLKDMGGLKVALDSERITVQQLQGKIQELIGIVANLKHDLDES